MKVLMKWGVVRDLPSDVAQASIAAGIADHYVEKPSPKERPAMQWSVLPAEGFNPPAIRFACGNCDAKGYLSSKNRTAHLCEVRHTSPHISLPAETVPDHIADEYKRQCANWRAPKPAPISAAVGHTPEQLENYRPKSVAGR